MQFEIIPRAEADVVSLMKSVDKVIINPLIFFLFALAMLYFLYGVAQYLLSPNNEEVRQTSKSHMLWGIVGLFIMVAVFGILNFITSSLGITNVKIDPTGNYAVTSTINVNGTTTTTTTRVNQTGLQIPQTKAPTADTDTSGGNTSTTLANQDPKLDPTKSPFPDYVENSNLCWHKVIHSSGSSEYNAYNPTAGGITLSLHDIARSQYIAATGQSPTVNQNLPVLYDSVVLYNKADKQYYAWVDARAPTNASHSSNDCDLKISPTQSSDNYTHLDKYKSNNAASTVVQTTAVNPNLSPFPDYDSNAMCWNQEFALTGDTEYKATQNVPYNGKTYPTLTDYLRARFLSSTGQTDANVNKSLPVLFDYQPLYDATKNKYNVWIDVRAPIGGGTLANCNLKMSAIQGSGNYLLTGKYQSSNINISAGQVAKNLDFTKSPFPAYILNPSACWRKEMLFKDTTEYKALAAISNGASNTSARIVYLNETHQVDNATNKSYPIQYGLQTAFNSADQMYYVWVDERAPIGTGTVSSCNLPALTDVTLFVSSIVAQTNSFQADMRKLQNAFQIQSTVDTIAAAIAMKADIKILQASFQQSQSKSNAAASATLKASIQAQSDALTAEIQSLQDSYQQTQTQANIAAEQTLDAEIKKQGDALIAQLQTDTTSASTLTPQAESTKTSSLTGSVQSDGSYYRVVDSGVSPVLSQARTIAINNALIQIAILKGVTDPSKISYTVIPPEKYYPLDPITGNYDYFVAVQSPK